MGLSRERGNVGVGERIYGCDRIGERQRETSGFGQCFLNYEIVR